MSATDIAVPAFINGLFTVVVLLLSDRGVRLGVLGSLAILAAFVTAMWVWPGSPSPSWSAETATYIAVVVVTWMPGAVLAIVAGRLKRQMHLIVGTISVCLAVLLGAAFFGTGFVFACGLLGRCP